MSIILAVAPRVPFSLRLNRACAQDRREISLYVSSYRHVLDALQSAFQRVWELFQFKMPVLPYRIAGVRLAGLWLPQAAGVDHGRLPHR